MSKMSDERRMFIDDCREKKQTARSARHTRTHCGKGGAVIFPSDYLTAKERKAMNGKCEEYRLNEPMTWGRFKTLPDDLKVEYVKTLRKKFNVPDKALADMFGVARNTVALYFKEIGLGLGKAAGATKRTWNKDGFYIWCNKVPVKSVCPEVYTDGTEKIVDELPEPDYTYNTLVPDTGEMIFEGRIDDILRTVGTLLCGAKVHLSIKWDVVEDRDAVDPATQTANLQRSVATATYALVNEERKAKLGTKG